MRVFVEIPSGAQSRGYERGDDWQKWFDMVVLELKRLVIPGASVVAEELEIEARRETV